jgi:hypothetical protein
MDLIEAINMVEGVSESTPETITEAWQHLIDTGMAWRLQGSLGRCADALIERGVCTPRPEDTYTDDGDHCPHCGHPY